MRELTSHKVNECNENIRIEVLDEPGQGNACHKYLLAVPGGEPCLIAFQNGPIGEVGTNGITQEALLAVIEDRLEGFQSGPYACEENAQALLKVKEAQQWLHHRTMRRLQRGVEGTHTV